MVHLCGIAGIYLRDPSLRVDLDEMLDTLLLEIEDRGRHATGFVAIGDEGVLEWQKASCAAKKFVENRRFVPEGARVILGHTRWATQGEPSFMENNHPIKRGPFFIIHNGHVNNDSDLFREAERTRFGQVDSEAIAARLASYGDLKFLGNVMEEIDGDAAVAAADERHGGMLALARGHSSPLYVLKGKRIVVFASTMRAVEKAYESHVGRLPKGGASFISEGTLLLWRNEVEYSTMSLTLPERWKYLSQGSDYGSSWGEGYVYSGSRSTQGALPAAGSTYASTKESDRALPLTDRGEWDDLNYGWIPCDSCGEYLPWATSFDLWNPIEKKSDSLCEECYDLTIVLRKEAEDAEWAAIDEGEAERVEERIAQMTVAFDADDADVYDGYGDYCGTGVYSEFERANNHILNEDDLPEESRSIVRMIRERIQARN